MAVDSDSENTLKFNSFCLDGAAETDVFQINFSNVNKEEEKETKEKYQCIDLLQTADNAHQKALWSILTVGRKNNYPQLLLILLSDYSRERIREYIRNKTLLSIQKWQKNSKAIKNITPGTNSKTMNDNIEELVSAALSTLMKRLCQPMNFSNMLAQEKINDSFIFFATQMLSAIELINNQNWNAPCQIDIWVIPTAVGHLAQTKTVSNDGNESSDFDDDSDDFDPDSMNDISDNEQKDIDCVLNIEKHIRNTIDEDNFCMGDNVSKLKRQFLEKIGAKTRRKRFCMIVSKSLKPSIDTNEQKEDSKEYKKEIFMYVPNKSLIPKNNICEWGINACLTDILPSSKCNTFPQITGKQILNGKMFILSLQKDTKDEIRAWLYYRNSMSRFYPSDILNVLPYLFVKNEQNQLTKKQFKYLKSLICKNPIPDLTFDRFSNHSHNQDTMLSART